MTDNIVDQLKSLHTGAVDARHGYEEALRQSEGGNFALLFREMIALHGQNADELANALHEAGERADDSGSFMSTIHRTIMDVRSLFGGLDKSVLPGLIDGEQRNVAHYDEALALPEMSAMVRDLLEKQRQRLEVVLARMRVMES